VNCSVPSEQHAFGHRRLLSILVLVLILSGGASIYAASALALNVAASRTHLGRWIRSQRAYPAWQGATDNKLQELPENPIVE
jgi:hypothetical protein